MKKFIYILLALAVLGAIFSGVLLFQHFYPESGIKIPFCGGDFDNSCSAVNQSDYSELFGIPLAGFGLYFYIFIALILLISNYAKGVYYRFTLAFLIPLSIASVGIDIALFILLVKIGAFCSLCIATYLINIGLLIVTWFWYKSLREKENVTLIKLFAALITDESKSPHKKAAYSSFILLSILLFFAVVSNVRIMKIKTNDVKMTKAAIQSYVKNFYSSKIENIDFPESKLILGNKDAKLTIVAYTDFLCTYCYRFYSMEKYLLSKFKNRIRIVHYNFPLDKVCNASVTDSLYPNSCVAAKAIMSAAELGILKYYIIEHFKQYNNYRHRYNLTNAIENFEQIVKKYNIQNISKETFLTKMNSPEIEAAIKLQVKIAGSAGVNGTPTLFLSNRKLLGAPPKEILEVLIKKELERLQN